MKKYYKEIPVAVAADSDKFRKGKLLYLLIFVILLNLQLTNAQYSGALIPDFRVNDDATNYMQSTPSIGVDGLGNFTIVWSDQRNTTIGFPYQSYCQRFAFDGTRLGNNFKIGPDTCGGGFIAVLSNGRFIVTWGATINGKPDIYFQRFHSNGTSNGGMFKVNDTNVVGAYASLSDIDADSMGNFIVVWNDYRGGVAWEADVYGQRYDSAGNRLGNNFKINDNVNQSSQAGGRTSVNKDGSFVVCWSDARGTTTDIYMQRYDRFGNTIGANQRVDDDVSNSRQGGSDIASDGRGYFIIAFDDYREIYNTPHLYYQVYDTLGNKVGPNRKADENFGQTGAWAPKVSMQANGKFIIGWSDERYNYAIPFAQRFNNDGTKIGVNFKIPEFNISMHYGLGGIFLHMDRIYSTWTDARNTNFDIFANVKSFINPDSILSNVKAQYQIPAEFILYPVYPNPFNPITKINYDIPQNSIIKLTIYDILGREVIKLVNNEFKQPGRYVVEFNGTNLASGVYFYRIEAGDFIDSKKMVLVK